jgi:hypothetical protein
MRHASTINEKAASRAAMAVIGDVRLNRSNSAPSKRELRATQAMTLS